MRTRIFSLYLLIHLISFCHAQNIISNGGFETRSNYQCEENPFEAFNTVQDWTDYWTAHLWADGCPLDTSVWWFYGAKAKAYKGFNSVGIGGSLLKEGVMSSIYIISELAQTLRAEQQYYFQLHARNGGIWHPNPDSLTLCDTNDPKQIEITFGNQNMYIPENFPIDTPFDLFFTSENLQSNTFTDWERFADCFVATEEHSHLALSLTRSDVEMSLPCVYRKNAGISYFNYEIDVDELILYPIPEKIDTNFSSCKRIEIKMDLMELANVPDGIPIRFLWNDGYEGAERDLSQFGIYFIDAILDCTFFPIQINLVKEDCLPKIYVPNAFSPNDDGKNDELNVSIETEFEIQNYSFSVFDRWGNLMFQTNVPNQNWNAKSNNEIVNKGLYVWSLHFDIVLESGEIQHIQENGTVSTF